MWGSREPFVHEVLDWSPFVMDASHSRGRELGTTRRGRCNALNAEGTTGGRPGAISGIAAECGVRSGSVSQGVERLSSERRVAG
jgi:hypothetical protein